MQSREIPLKDGIKIPLFNGLPGENKRISFTIPKTALMKNFSNEYLRIIGRQIKARRLVVGMKEDTLAKAVDVTQAVISQIERGKYDSLKTILLLDICEHLKIPPNELFSPPPIIK